MKRPLMKACLPMLAAMLCSPVAAGGQTATGKAATGPRTERTRWEQEARAVTITRDDWGIAHVHGKTDADAVFGMIYAQAEDDFNRIETNYLTALGRLAQAEGETAVWADLRARLFVNDDSLKAMHRKSPEWLRRLMGAWADGLNYYLATHPGVHPRALTRFEPWMALSFSEGSIGGDIERVSLAQLQQFYGKGPVVAPETGEGRSDGAPGDGEPRGSNGIAIAPANTTSHHALLLINPHTSFFFRSELHMTSDEGLNAYGAVTWGQFFVYQGFNERAGWMHTSSGADAIDEFAETVTRRNGRFYYRYAGAEHPVITTAITVPWRTDTGPARRSFTAFYTRHGPVVRSADGRWITISLMQEPVKALIQSYTRTKAHDYKSFRQTMELHTNSSNNTIFADADGNIAYFHGNFIPRRNPEFDWTRPVDGSNPATDWHGVLSIDETPRPPQSRQRLALQQQRLALVGGGTQQSEAGNLPGVRRDRDRLRARPSCGARARGPQRLHARPPGDRGVRQLSHLVRAAAPGTHCGVGCSRPLRPAPGEARRSDRGYSARGIIGGPHRRCPRRSRCSGAAWRSAPRSPTRGGPRCRSRIIWGAGRPPPCCSRHSTPLPPGSSADFGSWQTPWATSTASSASPATSNSPSPTADRASRCRSPRPRGDRSRRSARGRIRGRRSGTARAATASWRWWSSATACARGR